jgi:hypothetical protein
VEKRKNGEVLRKASAEGNAARARAPTNVFAMMLELLVMVVVVMLALLSSGVAAMPATLVQPSDSRTL